MSCITYHYVYPVSKCVEMLTIGTISDANTDVVVILTNTATGRKELLTTTSDGSGLVTVDISGIELLQNSSYQIEIGENMTTFYDITIDGVTRDVVLMPVVFINNATDTDVTLTAIQ